MFRWLTRWWRRRAVDHEMARHAREYERARLRTSEDWRDRELL